MRDDVWGEMERTMNRGGHGYSKDTYEQALTDIAVVALGFNDKDYAAVQRAIKLAGEFRAERSVDLGSSVVG
jgi:hypothetical protein